MTKDEFDTHTSFYPEGYALFGPDWIFLNILELVPNNRDYYDTNSSFLNKGMIPKLGLVICKWAAFIF